jgi:hypothetical protein
MRAGAAGPRDRVVVWPHDVGRRWVGGMRSGVARPKEDRVGLSAFGHTGAQPYRAVLGDSALQTCHAGRAGAQPYRAVLGIAPSRHPTPVARERNPTAPFSGIELSRRARRSRGNATRAVLGIARSRHATPGRAGEQSYPRRYVPSGIASEANVV